MNRVCAIEKPEELHVIIDMIHDSKFDKENIVFDSAESTLEIEFLWEPLGKKQRTIPRVLRILNVESFMIYEGEQIGPGSEDFFNTITFNTDNKTMWISTVIARGIEIRVSKFELQINS